jgi:PTS system mannitol-specific IIC component
VPSPGSIFALLAMTPKGNYFSVLAGVFVATAVSFLVASICLKTAKQNEEEEDLTKAAEKMEQLKGKKSQVAATLQQKDEAASAGVASAVPDRVKKIVFACDAGMGSSAMGASILRNKVQKAGLSIEVTNTAINQLPADADIVITHQNLTDRAKAKLPNAYHVSVENFLNSPKYDELIEQLKQNA